MGVGDDSCEAANPDAWVAKIQKALQIAESRELIGDRAIIEALFASATVTQGKVDQAFIIFRKALEDSIDSKREVLQADILVSLASEGQLKGNIQAAVDLVTQAASLSEKTGNLYGKARALGELGRLRMLQGKSEEASRLIDEALNIDRLNGYKFESLHLVYRASYLNSIGKKGESFNAREGRDGDGVAVGMMAFGRSQIPIRAHFRCAPQRAVRKQSCFQAVALRRISTDA